MIRGLNALLLVTLLALAAPSFAAAERHILLDDCVVAGCSNETCVDVKHLSEPNARACIVKPERSCYTNLGECKRQPTGQCGWTPSAALAQCVAKPPSEPGMTSPATAAPTPLRPATSQ